MIKLNQELPNIQDHPIVKRQCRVCVGDKSKTLSLSLRKERQNIQFTSPMFTIWTLFVAKTEKQKSKKKKGGNYIYSGNYIQSAMSKGSTCNLIRPMLFG